MKLRLTSFAQLFARIALGLGFLLPVFDRLGFLGAPGSAKVAWGDWSHFVAYTHQLMPFTNINTANIFGLLATIAECVLGVCLIVGYKVKWMGLGAAIITLTFAVFMILSLGISAPFNYPVFVFTGAGLLLYTHQNFRWSIDALLHNRKEF
ncbi:MULTISPECIES: DoxX family membrane protein [Niastella]|uniref:DoxX family membrane protein n=1 Tax=Niastella soli TaxID=2821487 RepID=A0ABS3YVH7_9BACT|nr:DoxX family membrane protein [Niastella soli]MBO9201915.1 DoxX family membrane protein [Niastella soli]